MATLFFIHIPKTAGTSLSTVLRRYYPAKKTYKIYGGEHTGEQRAETFAALPEAQRQRFDLIRGHYPFGLHNHVVGSSTYITMLRDPVERLVSLFHHIRQTPNHYAYRHGFSREMSLLDFVTSEIIRANEQTWYLTGGCLDQADPGAALETALANVRRHIAVVGLTERFDESLLLMRLALGWPTTPVYVQRRVNRKLHRGDAAPAAVRAVVEARNGVDIQLYERMRTNFDRTVAEQGAPFQRALWRFRQMKTLYRHYRRLRGWTGPRTPNS